MERAKYVFTYIIFFSLMQCLTVASIFFKPLIPLIGVMMAITWNHDSSKAHYHSFGMYFLRKVFEYSKLRPNKPLIREGNKCLYACHPHGIVPFSGSFFANETIPVVVDSNIIKSVAIGSFTMKFCGFIDNKKDTIIKNLNKYGACAIYPGGGDEMSIATGKYEKTRVYLRTGFIRLCIENEYDIIPTFIPHEELFLKPWFPDQYRIKLLLWKKLGISGFLHSSDFLIPFVPNQLDNPVIYIGNRIQCKKGDDVMNILNTYVEELKRLATEAGSEIDFINAGELIENSSK